MLKISDFKISEGSKLADVIDTGQLVAIKGHKTAIDTDSVAL